MSLRIFYIACIMITSTYLTKVVAWIWTVLPSNVVLDNCQAKNGIKTCCSVPSLKHQSHHVNLTRSYCKIEKHYISSEYEINQLKHSKEISKLSKTDWKAGKAALINFITQPEEMKAWKIWLKRVHVRMSSTSVQTVATNDDRKYLSRFEVTKTCGTVQKRWNEWIEPISIHTRDPRGMHDFLKTKSFDLIMSPDHILLQNKHNLRRQQGTSYISKSYMLDAGCSKSFNISTQWFLCAYAQTGVVSDQIYSYELEQVDSEEWWNSVPSNWTTKLHFHNIPISDDTRNVNNPLWVLRDIAQPHDFVAIKLDVDNPSIEIPIALQLLLKENADLVDEFFFELHYRCPILEECCWKNITKTQNGLVMDNYNALKLFLTYRKLGIRSHFWP